MHIYSISDSYNLTRNVSLSYMKHKEIEVQKDKKNLSQAT